MRPNRDHRHWAFYHFILQLWKGKPGIRWSVLEKWRSNNCKDTLKYNITQRTLKLHDIKMWAFTLRLGLDTLVYYKKSPCGPSYFSQRQNLPDCVYPKLNLWCTSLWSWGSGLNTLPSFWYADILKNFY